MKVIKSTTTLIREARARETIIEGIRKTLNQNFISIFLFAMCMYLLVFDELSVHKLLFALSLAVAVARLVYYFFIAQINLTFDLPLYVGLVWATFLIVGYLGVASFLAGQHLLFMFCLLSFIAEYKTIKWLISEPKRLDYNDRTFGNHK